MEPSNHDAPVRSSLEVRFAHLERRLRRAQLLTAAACVGLVVTWTASFRPQIDEVEHLRVRKLELVDDAGVVRVSLDQDPKDTQRRSRSAGLTVYDRTGVERGGFGTMDDGSVVFAMDAPAGVGAPMRDRLGLVVWPDGSSYVMLIDNETRAVAKLQSDGKGGGGVQVFKWDMEGKKIHVKTDTYDGDVRETVEMGG